MTEITKLGHQVEPGSTAETCALHRQYTMPSLYTQHEMAVIVVRTGRKEPNGQRYSSAQQ